MNYDERAEYLWAYKEHTGCMDCGLDDPDELVFHHRDPEDMAFRVSAHCRQWWRVLDEIEKCDVVCKSCHRQRHADN